MKLVILFISVILVVCAFTASIASTAEAKPVKRKSPGVVDAVYVYENVVSKDLGNKRTVRVWLPADYSKEPNKRFPVVYFHDGQNAFDPETSNWQVEWGIDETLTRLGQEGAKFSAIVVAVDALIDVRTAEYDYNDKGAKYASFLINTVKPMIDKDFRTLKGRKATYSMGSSMGALISVALVWKHPEIFSAAAALSLPADILDGSLFKTVQGNYSPSKPIRVYMDHGTKGYDATYAPGAKHFYDVLMAAGVPVENVTYKIFEGADHTEMDWAKRVEVPLRWLLN